MFLDHVNDMHQFTHSLNNYSLSAYYVPGTDHIEMGPSPCSHWNSQILHATLLSRICVFGVGSGGYLGLDKKARSDLERTWRSI